MSVSSEHQLHIQGYREIEHEIKGRASTAHALHCQMAGCGYAAAPLSTRIHPCCCVMLVALCYPMIDDYTQVFFLSFSNDEVLVHNRNSYDQSPSI